MTITHFNDLMAHAESDGYAIGYFECWSLESLMAVVDAAEALIAKNRPKASVSTDGGDFSIKQKAKKLDKFLFGDPG